MTDTKLSSKERQRLKEFVDTYLDKRYKMDWNVIKLSKADGKAHNQMVANVCIWCIHNDIPFLTQCRFNSGYRPDIICPVRLPKPIVEVRNTETEKESKAKEVRIPEALKASIVFVDANQEFKDKLIL